MYDIHFQNHIVVHEVGKSTLVGDDTTHLGSCQKDIFRLLCFEESLDLILTCEVKLLVGTCDDVAVALSLQFADNGTSHHATMSGYIDFAVLFHNH